jgi:plastocyanin
MHSFALKLGLVLAAEKSKTPFYIAGGVLVAWALFISLGIGMRKPSFPENLGQQRAVMAVSAVLVVIAVSMAVVTAGGSKSAAAATPAAGQTGSTAATSSPTATTGTPAPPSSPAAGSVALEANSGGQLSFNTTKLAAKAGKVTIEMANMSPTEHNLTLAQGSKVLGATPTFTGGKRSITLTLAAGSYTFYCSVPGHRQAGMEGVLTVTS